MNETEIRRRLRDAVGDARYPQDLPSRIEAELKQPRKGRPHTRALGLVAAVIAVAIVAALVAPRLLSQDANRPQPQTTAGSQIPDQDLAAAHLANLSNLVTPMQLSAQSGNQRITVLGAYADPARTVLFFRVSPDSGFPILPSVNDAYGFLNSSSSAERGVPGDYIFVLDAGPRPGDDGLAHLKVVVSSSWSFSIALEVQPSQNLAAVPARFPLGSWKVTLEVVEATPSVIHVQALIEGASPDEVGPNFATLLDPSGHGVPQVVGSQGVTVPKQQLNSSTYKITRVNDQWARPTATGTYQLHLRGNGADVVSRLDVPAEAATGKLKGGGGLQPTDYPPAQESLTLQGSLTTSVTTGRPSQCGAGTGPNGTVFAFATYFQAAETWYWLDFSTDPRVQQYSGPGTYKVPGWLYTVGPGGSGQVLYEGTVQLTVTSDRRPDASGSVQGTLTGLEVIAPQSQVTISGTWTCTWTPELGPG